MAGKKGQAQLQIEVATDEEWEKLLQKPGLIVVDVYSDWCGPCSAMLNNLRKVKLEIGGDNLHIAQAKCDGITDLSRFRNKSEPTWMMIAEGKVVNLIFGANSPKILSVILDELNKENQAREGTRERTGWAVTTLCAEEQEEFDAQQQFELEQIRIEEERRLQQLHEYRLSIAHAVLQNLGKNGVILIFPQAKDMVKQTLADRWEASGLAIAITERPLVTEAMLDELLYFTETDFNDIDRADLFSSTAMVYLTKPTSADFEGDVDDTVLKFIYGEMREPPGDEESPAQLLKGYIVVPKAQAEASRMTLHAPSNVSIAVAPSKLDAYASVIHSKAILEDTLSAANMVEEGDTIEVTGLWVPPNELSRAMAIKLLFPKLYAPIAIPEPQPIPPHIAIAFDALKRHDVFETLKSYEDALLQYGFFDNDKPDDSRVIAKNTKAYEKLKTRIPGIKLVLKLAKKKSDAWCALSQLNPTYMSFNTVEGEKDCKLFFPEDYDKDGEEQVVQIVEVKKKKGRKAKKEEAVPQEEEDEDEDEDEG